MAETGLGAPPQALLVALGQPELARHWAADVLARGAVLESQGAVQAFEAACEGAISAAKALVQGGARYQVQLTHAPGGAWRGRCDCPHAAGGHACKHQAAVALHWRRRLGMDWVAAASALSAPTAPPARPARTTSRATDDGSWRDFVSQQAAPALVERLLAWADRLPELKRDLQQWQTLSAPVADGGEAKKRVTSLLSGASGLYDARKVGAWVRKAEAVLTLIDAWLADAPALALVAAEAAYLKLVAVMGAADDSHGYIQGLAQAVADRWLLALQAEGEQPAASADRLLKLMAADEWGHLDWAGALAAAGAPVQTRMAKHLGQRWMATREEGEDGDGPREAYLRYLQAVDDVEEILRVRRYRLRSSHDHVRLVQALIEHGRTREAVQAAEHAHKLHPDDGPLTEVLVALYEGDGWDEEALALRHAQFARRPSNAGYHALLATAQRAGRPAEAERAALWATLHAAYQAAGRSRSGMGPSEMGSLMINLWVDEGRPDEALAWLAEQRYAGGTALMRLARALAPTQPEPALALYKSVLLTMMPRSAAPYQHELALVREAVAVLPREASRLWLAWLKLEYRHKPRFVEGLSGL